MSKLIECKICHTHHMVRDGEDPHAGMQLYQAACFAGLDDFNEALEFGNGKYFVPEDTFQVYGRTAEDAAVSAAAIWNIEDPIVGEIISVVIETNKAVMANIDEAMWESWKLGEYYRFNIAAQVKLDYQVVT